MKKERLYGRFVQLRGTVSSGLGRAHVFMSQPHYQDQFRTILGTTAWPGTLNVKVEGSNLVNYIALRKKAGIDTLDAEEAARLLHRRTKASANNRLQRKRHQGNQIFPNPSLTFPIFFGTPRAASTRVCMLHKQSRQWEIQLQIHANIHPKAEEILYLPRHLYKEHKLSTLRQLISAQLDSTLSNSCSKTCTGTRDNWLRPN